MKSANNTSDELLWQAFKNGDKAAYAFIYTHYFHILFKYGKKITADESLVQDSIQDLFIELLKRRQHLSDTDSIKFYLFKSLRRKLNHALLKQDNNHRKTEPLPDEWNEEYDSELIYSYEDEIIIEQVYNDRKKEVLKALELLTKSQKKAIELKFYHNLSYPEVAEAMSIHVDSVYNLISKATALLKKNVKKVYVIAGFFFLP
jgi:RNA polymerase sigma-70 factor (ECF subfamily)